MDFSPSGEFYGAAAQVIPVLLLAAIFEARVVPRLAEAIVTYETGKVGMSFFAFQVKSSVRLRKTHWTPALVAWLALLALGVLFVLAAEALAVVALAMKDPPEVMAILVLAGIGVLLLAMLVIFVDSVRQALFRRTESEPEEEEDASPGIGARR